MGYWTSHKEIQDIYHSVYLLRRSPGLPPCGSQQRREVIHDILSCLRSWLHQQVYPTAAKGTQGPVDKIGLSLEGEMHTRKPSGRLGQLTKAARGHQSAQK